MPGQALAQSRLFATWWLKSALTNAQISGLEAEIGGWKAKNEVLEERRHLAGGPTQDIRSAVEHRKGRGLQLSKRQIRSAGATKDELFRTISSATVSANNAISANRPNQFPVGRGYNTPAPLLTGKHGQEYGQDR